MKYIRVKRICFHRDAPKRESPAKGRGFSDGTLHESKNRTGITTKAPVGKSFLARRTGKDAEVAMATASL
jgi:hypothetical protein